MIELEVLYTAEELMEWFKQKNIQPTDAISIMGVLIKNLLGYNGLTQYELERLLLAYLSTKIGGRK